MRVKEFWLCRPST